MVACTEEEDAILLYVCDTVCVCVYVCYVCERTESIFESRFLTPMRNKDKDKCVPNAVSFPAALGCFFFFFFH